MVLDREQLREITLDDEELMSQIVAALIADTESQLPRLESAIRDLNGPECVRLAHYCKGACANVGAKAAAAVLARIERQAATGSLAECGSQVAVLAQEIERLRGETI